MMKKILVSVYTACTLLIIVGSIVWFVFPLHNDSLTEKANALNSFKLFARHTGNILTESSGESDPTRMQNRLEALCGDYRKYVKAVLIRNTGGTVFIWPQNAGIFSYNEQNVIEIKNMPLFFSAVQMRIPIRESGETVALHAALQTLPAETIFNRGRVIFFLLLILVIMTAAVLIFSYLDLKPAVQENDSLPEIKKSVPDGEAPIDNPKAAPDMEETAERTSTEDILTASPHHKDSASPDRETHKTAAAEKESSEPEMLLPLSSRLESLDRLHIYDNDPAGTIQDAYQEPVQPEERGTQTAASEPSERNELPIRELHAESYGSFENRMQSSLKRSPDDPISKPVTSFEDTPLSAAGRSNNHSLDQATLLEELGTAINETAVAEEDLTLLLIHATDIPHNQQIIHLLRTTLDRIHKIFIFNKDTIGLIIFYASLDQAMQIANTLYDEIHTILDAAHKDTLGIGLTTRAGRLIPAYRMIEEASAAIGKAIEEEGDPIVAFRVNPDKYRRCIARLS